MADEQTVPEQAQSNEPVIVETAQPQISEALQALVFGDNTQPKPEVQPEAPIAEQTEAEEILDETDYLKRVGFESFDALDAELKTLREKSKGFEWKNEDSRKVAEYLNEGKEDELYKYLDNKRRVEKLSSTNIADVNTAAELVKFGIQKENPSLTQDEVDFLFGEKYSFPSKPEQSDMDTDDEYGAKVQAWQNQVANIEKRMIIEAKMQQPKFAQLKSELVLPEINRGTAQQVSQEDLAAIKQQQDSFIQFAEAKANTFNGFNVNVKVDKDVNYTVAYSPSNEEKTFLKSAFKTFAESNFDANTILAERWVMPDGKTINVDQMQEDLLRIVGGKNIEQKIAMDSANKMREAYIKEKKHPNISNVNGNRGTFEPQQPNGTLEDRLRERMLAL